MKKEKIGKRTKAYRTVIHLTVSFPEDLAKELRKQKDFSALLASLYRAYLEKEQATPSTPTMSDEEVKIRSALKDRERLVELYGDKIDDVEYVIRKGVEWRAVGDNVEVKDWGVYMTKKGIEDKNGYFGIYEKYVGQHSEETLYDLWTDVAGKFNAEKAKEHEARLKREVAPGMTLQNAIDKIDAYRQRECDRKVQKLTDEAKAINMDSEFGALPFIQRKQIDDQINVLTERFKKKEASYNDIMNALGLPYQEIYNKVAAALRLEGYKIVPGKTA